MSGDEADALCKNDEIFITYRKVALFFSSFIIMTFPHFCRLQSMAEHSSVNRIDDDWRDECEFLPYPRPFTNGSSALPV
jgi:hypothetical protein